MSQLVEELRTLISISAMYYLYDHVSPTTEMFCNATVDSGPKSASHQYTPTWDVLTLSNGNCNSYTAGVVFLKVMFFIIVVALFQLMLRSNVLDIMGTVTEHSREYGIPSCAGVPGLVMFSNSGPTFGHKGKC